MPISKQELEFLMFLRRYPELSLNSPQLRDRFSNPHVLYKRILAESGELEREIPDFVTKVGEIQLFLDRCDKSTSPRSDVRELLAEKALDAIPVDKFEDFLSRYRGKVQRKTATISGTAWIAPPKETRNLFEEITSRRKWVLSFAYFAGLIEKSDLDVSGPGYLGGMKKFLIAKNLITQDGNLTLQGKRVLGFFKDEINAKIKKKKAKPPGPAT